VKTRQVKMKMLAKILKNASIILFWVAAALFGIFLLANFVLIFIPGKDLILPANLSGSFSGSINGISIFRVNPQTNGNIMIKPVLQALFLWLTVGAAMVAVILFEVKKILKTVCADNPFEKSNSKNLTVIACALIVGSLTVNIFAARFASAVIKALQIANMSLGYSIDLTLLLTGILILILAGVFRYGNYLQEEVDSTL